MKKGKVYIVGAGPGATDLITVRGSRILREAEVVIYDYLVNTQLLQGIRAQAELICCEQLGEKRDRVNALMLKKAKQGKKVVRLKGGDPSLFGRLSEEVMSLVKGNVEFEIVPGVTAGTAAACLSGIPLTDRVYSSNVVFVTGHETADKKSASVNWKSIAAIETIVVYMGVKKIAGIADTLLAFGKSAGTPVLVVSKVGRVVQRQLVTTLNDVAGEVKNAKLATPALFIIGKVASFVGKGNWFKKNKHILFTGLSEERFFLEGTFTHVPLIRIGPLPDYHEFDNNLKNIASYSWLVFTSRYGVEYFFQRLRTVGLDSRVLQGIQIAGIGNSTAQELSKHGIRADIIPKEESSRGLVKVFKKIDIRRKKLFIPRSDLSDKGLTEQLRRLGALVTASVAYRNVMPDNLPDLDLSLFDEIMFTSPSTVRNFVRRYGKVPKSIKIRCIGDVTKAEARKWFTA